MGKPVPTTSNSFKARRNSASASARGQFTPLEGYGSEKQSGMDWRMTRRAVAHGPEGHSGHQFPVATNPLHFASRFRV